MNKDEIKALFKDKLSEWFDEDDPRYQRRQEVLRQQEQLRQKLREQIRYYSFSSTSDEVMANMKGLLIFVAILCSGIVLFI